MKSVYALLRLSSISMNINFDLAKNCILPHKGITSECCKNKNDHIEIKTIHIREVEGVFYIQYNLPPLTSMSYKRSSKDRNDQFQVLQILGKTRTYKVQPTPDCTILCCFNSSGNESLVMREVLSFILSDY